MIPIYPCTDWTIYGSPRLGLLPPIPEATKQEIARLYRSKRYSINQISKRLGVAYGTAWNDVRALRSISF